MLISCNSCNSKYLINSADLKPDGRTVECANCGYQWYQENKFIEEENFTATPSPSLVEVKSNQNELKEKITNLPSTYVHEQKVSILNSFLVIFIMIVLILGFWLLRNLEINTLVLLKFYLEEFYFNLKLIFEDIVKVLHKIIN